MTNHRDMTHTIFTGVHARYSAHSHNVKPAMFISRNADDSMSVMFDEYDDICVIPMAEIRSRVRLGP